MPIPKKAGSWTVKQDTRPDGTVVIEMTHPDYGQVVSMGEPGIDPTIPYNNAVLASLEEEMRRAPSDQSIVDKVTTQRAEILTQKRQRATQRAIEQEMAQGEGGE